MRIAITHPFCWPLVRRGSERVLHDLSHHLARRGHDVTVISSEPGPRRTERDGDVARILLSQRNPVGVANRWLNVLHHFGWQVRGEVLRGGFDAVCSLNYHDAFGVLAARRGGVRPRLTFVQMGIASRRYFRTIPHDGMMFRAVLRRAEAVGSLSSFAQRVLAEEFGRENLLLRAPTDLAPFRAVRRPPADGLLRLIFAADADEPRKGALLLARAFALVHGARPEARLDFAGQASPATQAAILAQMPSTAAASVTFSGLGDVGSLPHRFARASLLVHPAIWEAQGMVGVEALAVGTPVVACAHSGNLDVVDNPGIGRLFSPGPIVDHAATDHVALAEAVLQASELAGRPETEALCRAHAERFDWARLGDAYEAAITGRPIAGCVGAPAWRNETACERTRSGPGSDPRTASGSA